MIARVITKEAHVPTAVLEKMDKRLHQRLDSYFRDEAVDETVVTIRVTEQKNTYKVEMTMPYLGHTLRTENEEREISLPALDKGIDIIERQMRKLRTRLGRDLRKKPVAPEEPVPEEEIIEEDEKIIRTKRYAAKPMSVEDAILAMNLLGHSFYMFNNEETGKAATVYRRKDGGCGLIELEDL
jgi:putative sigma-54 modulation protein